MEGFTMKIIALPSNGEFYYETVPLTDLESVDSLTIYGQVNLEENKYEVTVSLMSDYGLICDVYTVYNDDTEYCFSLVNVCDRRKYECRYSHGQLMIANVASDEFDEY